MIITDTKLSVKIFLLIILNFFVILDKGGDVMSIGEIIKKIRIEKGMTQKQLGEKIGMAESNIRKYESGKLNPKLQTLEKFAKGLEVPVSALRTDLEILTDETLHKLTKISDAVLASIEDEKSLIEDFRKLNLYGRIEAKKQISNLTKIKEYTEEHTTD